MCRLSCSGAGEPGPTGPAAPAQPCAARTKHGRRPLPRGKMAAAQRLTSCACTWGSRASSSCAASGASGKVKGREEGAAVGRVWALTGLCRSFSARVSCSGCRAASSAGNPAGLRNAVWPCPGSQGPCRGRAPQGGTRGINRSPRLPAFGARRPVPQPALTYSALRARGPRPRGAVTPVVDARARERGLTWFGMGAGGTRPAVVPGSPLGV